MIVVTGRVRTNAEHRKALIEVGQTVAQASRGEAGCIDYRLLEDSETPNDFMFVEQWRDEAALQEHFGTQHIARFMAAVPELLVAAPEVSFHTIERTRDLAEVSRR